MPGGTGKMGGLGGVAAENRGRERGGGGRVEGQRKSQGFSPHGPGLPSLRLAGATNKHESPCGNERGEFYLGRRGQCSQHVMYVCFFFKLPTPTGLNFYFFYTFAHAKGQADSCRGVLPCLKRLMFNAKLFIFLSTR